MNASDILGTWYCHVVAQVQSDEEFDAYGPYGDPRPPMKASRTAHAGATLRLDEDNRYELASDGEALSSFGTWSIEDGRLQLTEAEECYNGFDGLEFVDPLGGSLRVGFKLVPDAHDGLDVQVLEFGREEPATRPDDPIEALLWAEGGEMWDVLYELVDSGEWEAAEIAAHVWDAVVEGRCAADPTEDVYWTHVDLLGSEIIVGSSGGFTREHALYALEHVDPAEQRNLANILTDMLVALPAGPRDADLEPLVTEKWIRHLTHYRNVGGGPPEEFFDRAFFAQPLTDDISREYVGTQRYSVFDSIPRLFPPGHPEAAAVAIRYRGRGLFDIPLAFLRERGLESEAREAALAFLADEDNAARSGLWLSAILFATALTLERNEPLPQAVTAALQTELSGMIAGGLTADEKERVKALISDLPEDQRNLMSRRFFLDK